MTTSRERLEDSFDEKFPTRWGHFKKYVESSPLSFWPVPVIFAVAISRFWIDGLLFNSILDMVVITSLGTQWIGIIRSRRKMSNEHREFDETQLEKMFQLNKMSAAVDMPASVNFLSPVKPKFLRKFWYRLTKKRMLVLYSFNEGNSTSFTKYIVSEKDMFYLQLRNCIDTTKPKLVAEGREYLKNNKVATVL